MTSLKLCVHFLNQMYNFFVSQKENSRVDAFQLTEVSGNLNSDLLKLFYSILGHLLWIF